LAIDSSAHKKIKNENFDNFCKEITWILTLAKLAWYSTFKLTNLFVSLAMTLNLGLPLKRSTW
jgi:hypothetical protein